MVGSGVDTSADLLATAHARLLSDPTFQFAFSATPRPPKPPNWLVRAFEMLGHVLTAVSPAMKIGLWVLLGAGVAFGVFVLARELLVPAWRGQRKEPLNLHALGAAPSEAAARAAVLLAEADRLADEGRYAQAAHMLLLRSVQDVDNSRPGAVKPSLTSRDIAALDDLPPEPRAAFARIVAVVERGLFAGLAVDGDAWRACRDAYAGLTRAEAWVVA